MELSEPVPARRVMFVGGARHGSELDVSVPMGMLAPYVDIATSSTYYPETCAFVTTHPATGRPDKRYPVEVYVHEAIRVDTYTCMECQRHVPPNHSTGLASGHTVVKTPKEQHLQNGLQDAVMRRWFMANATPEPAVQRPVKRVNGASALILPPDGGR